MKKKEIIIVIFSCLLLIFCKKKEVKIIDGNKGIIVKIDSNYFPDVAIINDTKMSDEYHDVLYTLYKNENFKLLEKHILNYHKLAEQSETIKAITNTYFGYILNQRSSLDSAQVCFETGIKILNPKDNSRELSLAYSGKGVNFSSKQEFDNALKMHYKAISVIQKSQLQDKERLYYDEITNLGFTFFYNRNYDKSLSLLDSSLEYFEKINDLDKTALLESAKSVIFYAQGKYNKAIVLAKHSLKLRIRLNNITGQAESNNNIALSYVGQEKWKEALTFFKKAGLLYKKAKEERFSITIQQNIGYCLLNMNRIEEALSIYEKTYHLAVQKNELKSKRTAIQNLSKLYQMKGDFKKSLDLHLQFSKAKDSVFNIEKEKVIQDLSTKYETKQKEERIVLLQKDKHIANIQIGLILCVLIIVGIILLFSVLRHKKNKELMLSKQKLHQSEIDRFNAELKLSENELNNFAYKLLTKSKLIDELEEKLNVISGDKTEALDAQQVSQLSQMKILTEEDWIQFKEHFDKAYSGFIPFIRKKFNNLTPAELRLLLLIKLNIETNEISSMLGISQESVRKGKYRLKKKLELPEEEELTPFVQQIVFKKIHRP